MLPGLGEMNGQAGVSEQGNIIPERIGNTGLIMRQRLVKIPKMIEDFRFWTVARKYAFAREDMVIWEAVLTDERMEESIRAVGKISKNGLLYILKEEDNGWCYVESGRVRGFVRAAEVITGEEAVPILEAYQDGARSEAIRKQAEYTGIEGVAPTAREIVPWRENQAFTYLRATAGPTLAEKDYAIAEVKAAVMEGQDDASRTVGVLPKGGLSCILADKGLEWVYVESGDVRGFVRKECLRYGEMVTEEVENRTEEKFLKAKELVKPEENGACYYTLTSTKPGIPDGELRRSMIEFAAQFVGNPYVWGGTSLTQGADCSGFVQSIYKQYGYDIPRVACDQARYGTQIPVEDALPGDLIFYARDGQIHHVVMYAGDGKTIEAMSSDTGIVQSDVRKESAVWATRILKDENFGYAGGGIGNVNALPDMYGKDLGTFMLTYYCACEVCCDVETGITATGAPVVEGRTIAVDPNVIPYGTQVIIGGHIFTAEDCGGAIKENHIDVYVNDHETAKALGVNYTKVYLKK
ncbi:MAG: cell wall hydrolase [Dorea sp.]|nr:cell wall hydrolase [Dorea sp.]